jgi:hypothetical protein
MPIESKIITVGGTTIYGFGMAMGAGYLIYGLNRPHVYG